MLKYGRMTICSTIATICLVCHPYVVLSAEEVAPSDAEGIVQALRDKKVSLLCRKPVGMFQVIKFLCIQVKCDWYVCINNNIEIQEYPPLVETRDMSVNVTNVAGSLELTVAAYNVSAWDLLNHVVRRAGMSLEIRDFGVVLNIPERKIIISPPVDKITELKNVDSPVPPNVEQVKQMFDQATATVSAQYPQLDLTGSLPEILFAGGTTVVVFAESRNGATWKNAKERVRVVFDEKDRVVDVQLIGTEGAAGNIWDAPIGIGKGVQDDSVMKDLMKMEIKKQEEIGAHPNK